MKDEERGPLSLQQKQEQNKQAKTPYSTTKADRLECFVKLGPVSRKPRKVFGPVLSDLAREAVTFLPEKFTQFPNA